ncbi:NAD-dependent epimerase/dehydratase family protein [Bradyrhizobium sp.]|uniref:NAD-dependent epimerase/dehydratase family protein n=1 Tax=Bradyrhizobium sp. TaxID=376 RepID=UPI002D57B50B|nr:NAD-dependent epimerase/dehydratase family protein [Bradyrhizobium sp.]HZR74064.1 NAD-dependent epimerase/dehydratase family protein [Bradyrhizobium sp.]
MTKALVTGGTGFIGQHLVSALVARDRKVRVLDRRPPVCATPGVEYVSGSVLDSTLVDQALRDADEVYHLAGLPGMWLPDKNDFHAVNFKGTEIVIAAARKRGVARFLHCSTESILFSPTSSQHDASERSLLPPEQMPGVYTRSKMLAEQSATRAAAEGFPLVIGTPTMPIGPHDHNLTPPTAMLRQFLHGRIQMYLDFIVNMVDVRDVATGLILTMERGQIGHRYILGGESISLKRILKLMTTISGHHTLAIPVPGRIAEMAAGMLEFVADHITHTPPSGTAEGVRIALRATELSIEKAQKELGYAPRPIEPALRDTIAYLLSKPDPS